MIRYSLLRIRQDKHIAHIKNKCILNLSLSSVGAAIAD